MLLARWVVTRGLPLLTWLIMASRMRGNQKSRSRLGSASTQLLNSRRARIEAARRLSSGDLLQCIPAFPSLPDTANKTQLECLRSEELASVDFDAIYGLTKTNMEVLYVASSWGWEGSKKQRELRNADARFLLSRCTLSQPPVAFVHFRFTIESGFAVVYCYELQVALEYQRQGLGRRLMASLEAIARARRMDKVVLTVFIANNPAVKFYGQEGYLKDVSSPEGADYVILSKVISQ